MEASLFPGEASWLNPSPSPSSHLAGGCYRVRTHAGGERESPVKGDLHAGRKSLDWVREPCVAAAGHKAAARLRRAFWVITCQGLVLRAEVLLG